MRRNTMEVHPWIGTVPPQYLFENRKFAGIALEPPDTNPGSWIGAGKALIDLDSGDILLSARPRKAEGGVRGYRADIYRSSDGTTFDYVGGVSKEEVQSARGAAVHSIEGTQLVKDPATGNWHFYISIDTGEGFIWGGLYWETLLMVSPKLEGPWESKGRVLKRGQTYDANMARDISIDIIDGQWVCLYKATNKEREVRPALALSRDGITWEKKGPLTVDGKDTIAFLHGSFISGTLGPLFVGLESSLEGSRVKKENVVYADQYGMGHGESPTNGVAYRLDIESKNLITVYSKYWEPGSKYEHCDYPLLGYSSMLFDRKNNRFLMYVEAIDDELTKRIGINETVERVLVYETKLPPSVKNHPATTV